MGQSGRRAALAQGAKATQEKGKKGGVPQESREMSVFRGCAHERVKESTKFPLQANHQSARISHSTPAA
jgi:hypothetical protein